MNKYISTVTGHAIVLGGSGGIGAEIVRALVANGVSAVTIGYNSNRAKAEALQAEVEAAGAKAYLLQVADLTDDTVGTFEANLQAAVDAVGEEISIAVDSIGISPNVPFLEQRLAGTERDREGWRRVFEVNVFGTALAARAILERMRSKGVRGSYVIITSTNGINAYDEMSWPYDESKAALGLRVKLLAKRYVSFGIRVNGVAPGWIETSMNKTLPPDYRKKEMRLTGTGQFSDPAEIATVVTFLSSSGASFIHGQNVIVDGYYPLT
jgi:3-oxoacyl-[acyl-carrier protein] reductase